MTRRRFQRGSIYKRGKRKRVWVARFFEDVIAPDGAVTRIRRSEILGSVTEIPTRRQAEQVLQDRLRLFNVSDYRPSSSCMLREYAENRWLPEVLPTLKHSTKKHYQYILRAHVYPALGDMQLRLINRDVVQGFISEKLRSGLSWRTVKSIRTALGTVMGAAEMAELIPSNPVRKTRFPRRGPTKQRAEIAPEKILELLDALPEPSRSVAWLLVLTGLRIGELLALRWRNINLEKKELRVTHSVYDGHFDVPKTQRSQRSVPLGPKAVDILTARKPGVTNPDALVFATREGSAFDRHNLTNRHLKSTCKKLGLVGVNWHWLRHANATLISQEHSYRVNDSATTTAVASQVSHQQVRFSISVYISDRRPNRLLPRRRPRPAGRYHPHCSRAPLPRCSPRLSRFAIFIHVCHLHRKSTSCARTICDDGRKG